MCPRADGKWHITHAIEVERRMIIAAATRPTSRRSQRAVEDERLAADEVGVLAFLLSKPQ